MTETTGYIGDNDGDGVVVGGAGVFSNYGGVVADLRKTFEAI